MIIFLILQRERYLSETSCDFFSCHFNGLNHCPDSEQLTLIQWHHSKPLHDSHGSGSIQLLYLLIKIVRQLSAPSLAGQSFPRDRSPYLNFDRLPGLTQRLMNQQRHAKWLGKVRSNVKFPTVGPVKKKRE